MQRKNQDVGGSLPRDDDDDDDDDFNSLSRGEHKDEGRQSEGDGSHRGDNGDDDDDDEEGEGEGGRGAEQTTPVKTDLRQTRGDIVVAPLTLISTDKGDHIRATTSITGEQKQRAVEIGASDSKRETLGKENKKNEKVVRSEDSVSSSSSSS